jgi:hypothetical protein
VQQLTGVTAIVTEIGSIASEHNPSFGNYISFIINIIQFFAVFGAMYLLTKFGRKTIIVSGTFLLGIYDIILGIVFIFIE